jgi:hypothetical protein
MKHEVCGSCAYWEPKEGVGECRCFPPETACFQSASGVPGPGTWPLVAADSWCGEWFPRREDDA